MAEAKVRKFGGYYGITNDAGKWFHYYYVTEGQAQAVLENADYFRDPEVMRVNISYACPAKLTGEVPHIIAAPIAEAPKKEPEKECKGKAAARALAVLVLDPKIATFLATNDPKALEQAYLALGPFGWPDLDALQKKLGLSD